MVTLESVYHDEEMHSNEIRSDLLWTLVKLLQDFLFTQLLSILDHVYEFWVCVNAVTLLEDEWAHFSILLMNLTKRLHSELGRLSCYYFIHLQHLFVVFPLHEGEVFVCLTNIMLCLLWQESKISGRYHLPEDGLGPKIS